MRIGIMTWSKHEGYKNYGTALQVCALSHILKQDGHEVHVIDYEPRDYYTQDHTNYIKKIRNKIFFSTNILDEDRSKLFDDFFIDNVCFTSSCNTLSELENIEASFDCVVCGSDQIWSLYDPHYFLDFVKDKNKLLAYAPSVGKANIQNEIEKEKIKKYVERFNYISTREEVGSCMLSELIGKDVITVLDPTLLLSYSEWCEKCFVDNEINEDDYILVYLLGTNSFYWKVINKISKMTKLQVKIIPVFKKDYSHKGCIKEPVGPNEFVKLFSTARMIVTDSFHGMLFSIIFKKRFVIFKRFQKNDEYQNNRIFNILNILGVQKQLYSEHVQLDSLLGDIDYDTVYKNIEFYSNKSKDYLKKSLLNIEKYLQKDKKVKKDVKHKYSVCCGCGTCKYICPVNAIDMVLSPEGFYEARVDYNKCINCGKCSDYCAYQNSDKFFYLDSKCYSYKYSDNIVLKKSSSGGAAYAISKTLLEEGYKIIGCMYDEISHNAKHIAIESLDELYKIQGSKYLQSRFFNAYDMVSNNEKLVFLGTPCQISGAKRIYGNKAVYVDLICHGVPSYNLYNKYINYMSKMYNMDKEKMKVTFRNKNKGWSKRYISLCDDKKTVSVNQRRDLFYLMFEHELCYGKQCYECPWRCSSEADLRIGDFWGPKFKKDKTGVSIILVNTSVGARVVDKMGTLGVLKEESIDNYKYYQQLKNRIEPLQRDCVINELSKENSSLESIVKNYVLPLEKSRKKREIIIKIKNVIKKFGL